MRYRHAHRPVSYTHLDVYKRQELLLPFNTEDSAPSGTRSDCIHKCRDGLGTVPAHLQHLAELAVELQGTEANGGEDDAAVGVQHVTVPGVVVCSASVGEMCIRDSPQPAGCASPPGTEAARRAPARTLRRPEEGIPQSKTRCPRPARS